MELNITILNFLLYEDKDTHKNKVRIGYINNDKQAISNSDKFKGYAELSLFLDNNNDLFNKLDVTMCGDTAVLVLEKQPNPRNPMRDYYKGIEIKTSKHGNISLL